MSMKPRYEQRRVRGRAVLAPFAEINNRTVIVTGKWIKTAVIKDEELIEGEPVECPDPFIAQLKKAALSADLFTFAQNPTETKPRYEYHLEWDNSAVIPLTKFDDWWEKRLSQDTRRNVRKATKAGLIVKAVPFDESLIRGVVDIYNETPVRQGKRFYHYGKHFETVKEETGTYLDRSEFIGAYYEGKLIGFIKIIYAGCRANIIHIVSKTQHYDKRPSNALMAKAVEIGVQKGMKYLTYCKYTYHKNDQSPLTEFKRRNGFEKLLYPRYFVPLTLKGQLVLALRLHRGLGDLLPRRLYSCLLGARTRFFEVLGERRCSIAGSTV